MAQHDKDETELKLSPGNLTLCATNRALPAAAGNTSNHDKHRSAPTRPRRASESAESPETREAAASSSTIVINRCHGCQRKVGLTGFRCRCGELFCWEHRYSDRHECGFDYKAVGREAIARENPVMKAAKIVRI